MRVGVLWLLGLACTAGLYAMDGETPPGSRYGVALDLKTFPQGTAKETLASVLKAAEAKQFDYLDAQLAEPSFIDDRVHRLFGGAFDEQVKDTRARLDPLALKQLHRFLEDGEWKTDDAAASVRLKDQPERGVFFVQKDGRWYMEHRSKAKETK